MQIIGRRALGLKTTKKTDEAPTSEELERLTKFKESLHKCGVQILFTSVLLLVALPKPWFWNTKLFWSECTAVPCNVHPSLGERFVYCLELAFYSQGIPGVFLWETKRKDRWELFAHHVATVVLIAYSYYLNLTRVGVMVLVCHEMNDIFMEAAKMSRYAKAPEWKTTSLFVIFMLSWFVTRIYLFGFVVIRSTLFESYERAAEVGVDIFPHAEILNGFLMFLYVLHLYWSYLIVRIAVRQITTGRAEDIREVEEPEEKPLQQERDKLRRRSAVGPKVLNPTGTSNVADLPREM